jgi:hypothetical protein
LPNGLPTADITGTVVDESQAAVPLKRSVVAEIRFAY